MDSFDLLKNLNDKQREAVSSSRINLLILAGAGSGKTRVLVHRVAWLQNVENCSPYSIMAVTFTNKAATEMKNRVSKLIETNQDTMWIGTFHGITHRLLRFHHTDAGLTRNFQILDEEDQLRLLKRILKDMNLDEKRWDPRQAKWYINSKKEAGMRPHNIQQLENLIEKTWRKIYQVYQDICHRSGLVDFSELLLRSYELLVNNPNILQTYRERFTNILVDEFQDTNSIQYAWIRLLAGRTGNIMAVGDDDQSIYGWRGAKVANIYNFLEDFPSTKVIRLEQNYRSTSNILTAANALIANNSGRLSKKLWTNKIHGEPISLYCAMNELDEAYFVVDRIIVWMNNGGKLSQCAILYRNNSQSRVIEETLLRSNIPYSIYGGIRFFDRQEIKNALSYLRLIANRNDDTAFERIVNTPKRGIGQLTFEIIRQESCNRHLSLWETSCKLLQEKVLSIQVTNAIKRFVELIDTISQKTSSMPLYMQTEKVIKDSGLWIMYEKEEKKQGRDRIDNLKELITATRQFVYNSTCGNCSTNEYSISLQGFLSHVTLENAESQVNARVDAVQLMTLHSAKGLEFPQVFIVGMEEETFPRKISLNENERIEEERRLAYVGITRAIKKLTLSYAGSRRLYGKEVYHQPSRFIRELPRTCIEEIFHHTYSTSLLKKQNNIKESIYDVSHGYRLGQRVRHAKFGEGTIINLEGSGKRSRLQVAFYGKGIKWLVAAYTRLEILSEQK